MKLSSTFLPRQKLTGREYAFALSPPIVYFFLCTRWMKVQKDSSKYLHVIPVDVAAGVVVAHNPSI